MSKVMLINVSHEEESRLAIVEGGVLEWLEIESSSPSLKGNIYKAVVQNVNAALEAAFLNYGDERAGFLPLDEVNFKVLPALPGRESRGRRRITDHVQPGMEIIVQVSRDAYNSKPPTFTTFYSLPGRYLVLTPQYDAQGISRKIEDESEREHLKKIVEELEPPDGYGVIVRTAGLGQSKSELQRDMRYLLRVWESINGAAEKRRAPSLIYQERDIVLRTIRDHFSPDIEEVLIDDEEVYQKARRFVQAVMPQKENVFNLYTGDKPVFSKYNLEDQIESIFRREVGLKSGGAIVIDQTEALTAVDVNSARSGREGNIEDTATKTNTEAAREVARQLRLRDLGGLIVIDFIDMYQSKNVRAVEKAMRESLKKDRAKWDISRISKFGLMEISRQRIKVAKASAAYMPCSRCEGTGLVKTTEAAALSLLRRIQARVVKGDISVLTADLPEDVAVWLLNNKRDMLHALERRYRTRIQITPQSGMNPNRGEIDTVARPPDEEPPAPPVRASRPAALPLPLETGEEAGAAARGEEGESRGAAESPAPAGATDSGQSEGGRAAPEAEAAGTPEAPRRRRRRRSRSGAADAPDAPEGPEGHEASGAPGAPEIPPAAGTPEAHDARNEPFAPPAGGSRERDDRVSVAGEPGDRPEPKAPDAAAAFAAAPSAPPDDAPSPGVDRLEAAGPLEESETIAGNPAHASDASAALEPLPAPLPVPPERAVHAGGSTGPDTRDDEGGSPEPLESDPASAESSPGDLPGRSGGGERRESSRPAEPAASTVSADAAGSAESEGSTGSGAAPGAESAEGDAGGQKRPARRRRRRRRRPRRTGEREGARAEGPAGNGASDEPAAPGGEARGDRGDRRDRGGRERAGREVASRGEPARDRSSRPARRPDEREEPARPVPAAPSVPEEEPVPGGWWQKLTGGTRRGGR